MLNSRPIDISTFQQLKWTTATVVEVQAVPNCKGLLAIRAALGPEATVLALATSQSAPVDDPAALTGTRVVMIEKLHPLTLGSETYTRTLLTTGRPERWVVLAEEVPTGASLF